MLHDIADYVTADDTSSAPTFANRSVSKGMEDASVNQHELLIKRMRRVIYHLVTAGEGILFFPSRYHSPHTRLLGGGDKSFAHLSSSLIGIVNDTRGVVAPHYIPVTSRKRRRESALSERTYLPKGRGDEVRSEHRDGDQESKFAALSRKLSSVRRACTYSSPSPT